MKADTSEEIKRNSDSMKQMYQLLKVACQERDEARDQLQKLLSKIMPSNDQQTFNATNLLTPNCFVGDQHHQGPLMIPTKANSSITESNSLSDAYNHSSSPVESLFDPISSPEFSNINVETPYAGPLPRWRNPPPLRRFNIPPMAVGVDQVTSAQRQSVGNPKFLNSPMMMLKQSQPYAEMACSSQMMVTGGVSGGGELDVQSV